MNATKEKTRRESGGGIQATTASVSTTPILPAKPARVKRDQHAEDRRIAAAVIRRVDWDTKTYEIESDSNPGTWHLVRRTRGEWTCTCSSHLACWHQKAVQRRLMADLRRQTAMMNAWLADMVRPGLVPTPVVLPAEEPECCDLEPTRAVEVHEGWEYKPAAPELMEAMGW